MICFMTIPKLRKLGRQAELPLFNKKVKDLGYNSMEVLLASVFYRFALDKKCGVLVIRNPKEGDEPFEGLRISKEFSKKRINTISLDMMGFAQELFGETYTCVYHGTRCMVFIKQTTERGDWDAYEYELAGKDGVSIPAKFARHSR